MTINYPIVTAPVLIPYTPDCEYQYGEEILPPEKIRRLANSFNDYKIIDLQHEYTKRIINKQKPIKRGELLNSYISTEEMYLKGLDGFNRKYPSGTWIITVKITDPEAMTLYNKGQLTGFSVTVKEKDHADAILDFVSQKELLLPSMVIESEKDFTKKPKRILMKDVKNPVAFTVSLVKQPCVYGAKFCRKSCLIVNKNKLKENKDTVSIKEKIKAEINSFIDGLDEESIKEDLETESEKQEETEPVTESVKEDDGGEEGDGNNSVSGGDSSSEGGNTSGGNTSEGGNTSGGNTSEGGNTSGETTPSNENTSENEEQTEETTLSNEGNGGNGTGKKVIESTKTIVTEDLPVEEDEVYGLKDSEKCGGKTSKKCKESQKDEPMPPKPEDEEESEKCGGKTSKKCKDKEAMKEEVVDTTESDKSVLYLAQDDVEDLIKTTLQRYAEEIEQMVFDGIQEALDEYQFADAMKEDRVEPETEEKDEEEDESVEEYATKEMVESIFEEQFSSFKSDLMGNIKKAQKESIKSYSKAINPESDGFAEESKKGYVSRMNNRDVYGRRLRKN